MEKQKKIVSVRVRFSKPHSIVANMMAILTALCGFVYQFVGIYKSFVIVCGIVFAFLTVLFLALSMIEVNIFAGQGTILPCWDTSAIEKAFSRVRPNETIYILQTWIPDRGEDQPETYIEVWRDCLEQAVTAFRFPAAVVINVLLMGDEELLKARVRYRDLGSCTSLLERVEEAKKRVKRSAEQFVNLMGTINGVNVNVVYYNHMPCGPMYVFGDREMYIGFYDREKTSDCAPMLKIKNKYSKTWRQFYEQISRTWVKFNK